MQTIGLVRLCNPFRLPVGTRPTLTLFQLSCELRTSSQLNYCAGPTSSLPERPKRPANAFIRFVRSVRASLLAKNPNATPGQISKLAAIQWQVLDPASKSKLTDEYMKEQAVWLQENSKYLNQLTDQQKNEIREARAQKHDDKVKREHRKRVKELGKPKRPLNGFLLYCADNKAINLSKEENKLEIKKMAEKWGKLSDAEKEPYTRRAAEALVKFHTDLSKWEEEMMAQNNMDVIRRKNVIIPPRKGTSKSLSRQ
ncbi:transcription factor A, mitochondrial [Topomyia yanbarensis]|uniref:transcription factor A, mitochondrial n=1 Tax=Topomyia yanbarensis TaxID=2498891 RepID=UPI00273CD928|nr:transcription factor A, mitochondrial [Topomyia yanbarensis]